MKEVLPANTRFLLLTALILSSFAIPATAYYHPDEGRWLSRDPIGEEGALQLYEYVQNNPPNTYDNEGLWVTPTSFLNGAWERSPQREKN